MALSAEVFIRISNYSNSFLPIAPVVLHLQENQEWQQNKPYSCPHTYHHKHYNFQPLYHQQSTEYAIKPKSTECRMSGVFDASSQADQKQRSTAQKYQQQHHLQQHQKQRNQQLHQRRETNTIAVVERNHHHFVERGYPKESEEKNTHTSDQQESRGVPANEIKDLLIKSKSVLLNRTGIETFEALQEYRSHLDNNDDSRRQPKQNTNKVC